MIEGYFELGIICILFLLFHSLGLNVTLFGISNCFLIGFNVSFVLFNLQTIGLLINEYISEEEKKKEGNKNE